MLRRSCNIRSPHFWCTISMIYVFPDQPAHLARPWLHHTSRTATTPTQQSWSSSDRDPRTDRGIPPRAPGSWADMTWTRLDHALYWFGRGGYLQATDAKKVHDLLVSNLSVLDLVEDIRDWGWQLRIRRWCRCPVGLWIWVLESWKFWIWFLLLYFERQARGRIHLQ